MSLVDDKPPSIFDRHPVLKATLGTPGNAAITFVLAALAVWLLPHTWDWFIWKAVWTGTADDCNAASGACWAFIGEKLQFIVTGLYPPEQNYRAYAACGLLFGLLLASMSPRTWGRGLLALWIVGIGGAIWLLGGGGPLAPVATDKWGGLPVTLFLSIAAFLLAFPLAIGLALARRSRLGGLRLYAVTFIELVRGVPFIAILYAATLLFPLMLPEGASIDKFARATVALSLFVAAYLAEIVRAGLQAIPNGQYEAAQSLGLTWWQATRLIVLPQALKTVIPAIINLAIGIFQDTTLVAVIGMFDLLNAARVAANDQIWLGYYTEAYVFVALVYFLFCFSSARYSLWLERRLSPIRRH